MEFKAFKMDGLGNDFIIIDQRIESINLSNDQIIKICDRKFIGCDQLIYIKKDSNLDAELEFYNSDGSKSDACGNGTRCVAHLIAKENNLLVIEDACLATGAEYNKKKIGSLSDLCVFSTNPGKVLDGIGSGGVITTNNKKLFITLKKLRDYGRRSRPSKWPVKSDLIGYNSKMSSINAAILNIRLRYLDMYIEKRNHNALMYMNLLDSKKIKFQKVLDNSKSAWRNFTIRVKNRNKIYSELYDKNFKVALGYLPINYKDVCYKKLGKNFNLKTTKMISSEIINLPCHQYMTKKEIAQISKNILSLV